MPENRGCGSREGERLAQQGVENPYEKFCGRLTQFMSARSKHTKIGDVTFFSPSIEEVAQRVLRETIHEFK
jgi:hypothetical protein